MICGGTSDRDRADQPRKRRLACALQAICAAGDDRARRAVDHRGTIAAGLHAAEGGADLGQRLELVEGRGWLSSRTISTFAFEFDARGPCSPRARKPRRRRRRSRRRRSRRRAPSSARAKERSAKASTSAREIVVAPGEILRRAAHRRVAGRVEQRLPQEILEFDLAHAKAAAMRVGGDRIAAHRFRADAERDVGPSCSATASAALRDRPRSPVPQMRCTRMGGGLRCARRSRGRCGAAAYRRRSSPGP